MDIEQIEIAVRRAMGDCMPGIIEEAIYNALLRVQKENPPLVLYVNREPPHKDLLLMGYEKD